MKNPIGCLASWFFNLGTKSGMPKYTALLGLLQAVVLFIPESTWAWIGINSQKIQAASPAFIQYYIINSSFKNAMSVFWMLSPFTFTICTALWIVHLNTYGYQAFLCRRMGRLRKAGKTSDYSLDVGILLCVMVYAWSTGMYLAEPTIFGGFVPPNNRFAMLIIHAGALGLFLPGALGGLVADVRANLTATDLL